MKVNIIGIILFVTGIIVIIVGVYSAYQSANYENPIAGDPYATTMDWHMFFMVIPSSVAYGMALIGLSEVIRLLHKQHLHTPKNHEGEVSATASAAETENTSKTWALSKADDEKIYELYSNKAILEIIPTHKERYCIIKLQERDGPLSPYLKVVDVGGFGAKEVHDEEMRQEIMNWYENQNHRR